MQIDIERRDLVNNFALVFAFEEKIDILLI